jgi:hypothetical protein
VSTSQVQAELSANNIPMGLGEVNGDGTTAQTGGNLIRQADPAVHLGRTKVSGTYLDINRFLTPFSASAAADGER